MHKLGEVLAVLILLTSLAGCSFDSPTNWVRHYLVSSADVFAINGAVVYVGVSVTLPVTIYNPNAYPITVTVGEELFAVPAHGGIVVSIGADGNLTATGGDTLKVKLP